MVEALPSRTFAVVFIAVSPCAAAMPAKIRRSRCRRPLETPMLWHLKRMEGAGLFRPRAVLCGRLSQEKEVHFCRSLVPRRKHRCHRTRVDMTGAFLKNGGRACKPDSVRRANGNACTLRRSFL